MSGHKDYMSMVGWCTQDVYAKSWKYTTALYSNRFSPALDIGKQLLERIGALCGMSDGLLTSSSSHSNFEALRRAKAKTLGKYILCTSLTHQSVRESCEALGLEDLAIPVDNLHRARDEDVRARLPETRDIAAIVSTYGTTSFGEIETLHELPSVRELRANGVWTHIDAAYGGMLGAFLSPEDLLTFTREANSVTIDPYKFIGVPGNAVLLLRQPGELPTCSYYCTSGLTPHTTLAAASGYTALKMWDRLGDEGMMRLANRCRNNAIDFGMEISKLEGVVPSVSLGIVSVPLEKEHVDPFVSTLLENGFLIGKYAYTNRYRETKTGIRAVFTPRLPERRKSNVKALSEAFIAVYQRMMKKEPS